MQTKLRWLLATARLRAARLVRDVRRSARRHPAAASIVPTPPRRPPRGGEMRLRHVLVSSDLNPRYVDCWPLARRAWREIAGLEPILVLIAADAEVPETLRSDPHVRNVEPVPGIHTAFQAQCVRLLYPALVDSDGAVLISDVDMVPLAGRYFHRPASLVAARHFLAYRDALLWGYEIPVCYNAALPRTWGEIFGIETVEDVRGRLSEWGSGLEYDGTRGGRGWDTDQVILYRTLVERGRRCRDVWILDDRFSGHYRLEWGLLEGGEPNRVVERGIQRGVYSDFHLVQPCAERRELNELIVELGIAAAAGRAR